MRTIRRGQRQKGRPDPFFFFSFFFWFVHESPVTTHRCVEADLPMKERALANLHEPNTAPQCYRPPDSLIDLPKTLRL